MQTKHTLHSCETKPKQNLIFLAILLRTVQNIYNCDKTLSPPIFPLVSPTQYHYNMIFHGLLTLRGRTHGVGCVRQWFRTAEPLGERCYENRNTHTHTHTHADLELSSKRAQSLLNSYPIKSIQFSKFLGGLGAKM